jgi:hypothetical protein
MCGTNAVVALVIGNYSGVFASRTLHAMSTDGLFFRAASRVNKGGTPALALSTAVGMEFCIFQKFIRVIDMLAFFFVANYTLSFISMFRLRMKEPEMARPYRAGLSGDSRSGTGKFHCFPGRRRVHRSRQHTMGAGHAGSKLPNFPCDEIIFAPSQRVALLLDLFRNRLRLQKQVQVVFAAGLRIRPGHIESAKRMRPHHGAGAFPVQI